MVIKFDDSPANDLIMEKRKNRRRKSTGNEGVAKKNSEKASSLSSPEKTAIPPLLEGMSAAEVTMIRKLAGNDVAVRKKTMRKLRKWLSVVVLRFPDDSDSRSEIEPNIVRVWKALFYCMWMADKPLPQEQLAEQISNLVHIFGIKSNVFLIFVEWFYRTMAREWPWIDRFRLDKFMMLCRRFLRQTLTTIASRKWNAEMVDGFNKIIRMFVFNQQPSTKFSKGTESSLEAVAHCPVGMQIHLVDIYLEELAKTGAEFLKSAKVLKLLSPFIEEMATNSDQRILDAITERIFHHLMKQSDVGIEYQERLMGLEDEEEDEDEELQDGSGEENDSADEDSDEVEVANREGEDEVFEVDNGPLDPRAGAVDVFLPQLDLDYSALVEKLLEAGGNKTVRKRNRGKLYTLAASFKDLLNGKYPLALPEQERWTPVIPQKELDKAAQRMLQLELQEQQQDGIIKVRRTKKQRRRDAKRLQQQEQLDDTMGSEDRSAFLNDNDLINHVSDNYASYVHEQMEKSSQEFDKVDAKRATPKKVKKRKNSLNGEEEFNLSQGEMPKLKKKKYKTVVEFESDEVNQELSVSVEQKPKPSNEQVITVSMPKVKRKSLVLNSENNNSKQIKRNCKSLSPSRTINFERSSLSEALNDRKIQRNSIGKKNPSPSPSPPKLTPMVKKAHRKTLGAAPTPSSEARRRINFVLAKNLEHEATDYMPSISKSPAIPYDAGKTPTSGILKTVKNRTSTPATGMSPLARKSFGLKTSPRKRALDFFDMA